MSTASIVVFARHGVAALRETLHAPARDRGCAARGRGPRQRLRRAARHLPEPRVLPPRHHGYVLDRAADDEAHCRVDRAFHLVQRRLPRAPRRRALVHAGLAGEGGRGARRRPRHRVALAARAGARAAPARAPAQADRQAGAVWTSRPDAVSSTRRDLFAAPRATPSGRAGRRVLPAPARAQAGRHDDRLPGRAGRAAALGSRRRCAPAARGRRRPPAARGADRLHAPPAADPTSSATTSS